MKVVGSLRTSATPGYAWGDVVVNFNGVSTNRSQRGLYGNGSSALSFSNSDLFGRVSNNQATSNTFGSFEMYIPNYTGNTNKSVSIDSVSETNATAAIADLIAGLWSNTAAITSIRLTPDLGNFMQHSTATLYGVTSAQGSATGGFVTSDANYYYHTFTSSGTFTPLKNLTCDVLVVAGGGGGGGNVGGGGGAGGLLGFVSQSLTATNYTVTVGAGGASGGSSNQGSNGSDSQFGGLTLVKGGGGGGARTGANDKPGLNGGSGGGGPADTGSAAAGTGTSGQGFAGGTGIGSGNQFASGAGGGAGAVGGTGTVSGTIATAGTGGAGINTYSTWASATSTGVSGFFAGGGGGGAGWNSGSDSGAAAGGAGGGGAGGSRTANTSGVAAVVNTGGGGGGGGNGGAPVANGAAGGSGIVIVRYAK